MNAKIFINKYGPTKWAIVVDGLIIAVCPSESAAKVIIRALKFFDDHMIPIGKDA